ncbi:hypothetical protein HDV02_004100 [Globomyces sp. JEL0801]|nr:hypothetical protein HDV02_004100 [Globomyces sp. JEL0801]
MSNQNQDRLPKKIAPRQSSLFRVPPDVLNQNERMSYYQQNNIQNGQQNLEPQNTSRLNNPDLLQNNGKIPQRNHSQNSTSLPNQASVQRQSSFQRQNSPIPSPNDVPRNSSVKSNQSSNSNYVSQPRNINYDPPANSSNISLNIQPDYSPSIQSQISVSNQKTDKPKTNGMSAMLKGLENKPKPELLAIMKKMLAEINAKNRIINNSKTNQNWLVAELAVYNDKPLPNGDPSTLQEALSTLPASSESKKIFECLLTFKEDLEKSKKAIEEHEVSLLALERKRTIAEEKAAYLKSFLDPKNPDHSGFQAQRIEELEAQLNDTTEDFTSLQAKVSQWATTSKRNQEGRIAAEAAQKALEAEKAALNSKLQQCTLKETSLLDEIDQLHNQRKSTDNESEKQLSSLQKTLLASQARISVLEKNLGEANSIIETLENENLHIQNELNLESARRMELFNVAEELKIKNSEYEESAAAKKEFSNIIKRSSMLPSGGVDVAKSLSLSNTETEKYGFDPNRLKLENDELRNNVLQLENDLDILKETNRHLQTSNQELQLNLETLEKQNQNIVKRQSQIDPDLVQELEAAKRYAEESYSNVLRNLEEAELMLEDSENDLLLARERIAFLENSKPAEVKHSSLELALEEERVTNQELSLQLQQYANQIRFYQQEAAKKSDDNAVPLDDFKEIQNQLLDMQESNEMLNIQLEERTQDMEMLEQRLKNLSRGPSKEDISRNLAETTSEADRLKQDLEESSKSIENLKNALSQKELTLKEYDSKVSNAESMVKPLKEEIALANQKLATLQKLESELQQESVKHKIAKDRIKQLEFLLKQAESREEEFSNVSNRNSVSGDLQNLKSDVTAKQNEIEHLKNDLLLIKKDRDELAVQLDGLILTKVELQKQKQSNDSLLDFVKDLEGKLSEAEEEIHLLNGERGMLLSQVEALEAQSPMSLPDTIGPRLIELEKAFELLSNEKEELLKQIAMYQSLENDFNLQKGALQTLEADYKALNEDYLYLEKSYSETNEDLKAAESQLMSMQNVHQQQALKLKDDFAKLLEEQDHQLLDLQAQLDTKESLLASLQKEVDDLKASQTEANGVENVKAVQELEENVHQMKLLNEEIANLKSQLIDVETQLTNSKKDNVDQIQQLKDYYTNLLADQPKDTNSTDIKRIEELENQIKTLQESQNNTSKSEIDTLKEKLIALEADKHNQLIQVKDTYTRMLEDQDVQIEELFDDIGNKEATIKDLQAKLSELENSGEINGINNMSNESPEKKDQDLIISDLKNEIATLNLEINKLKEELDQKTVAVDSKNTITEEVHLERLHKVEEEYQFMLADQDRQIETLFQDLEGKDDEITGLTEKCNQLKNEIASCETREKSLESSPTTSKELEEQVALVESLRKQMAELELGQQDSKDILIVKQELAEKIKTVQELELTLSQLKQEQVEVISKLKASHDAKVVEHDKECEELFDSLDRQGVAIMELEQKLEDMTEQHTRSLEKNQTIEKELSEAKKELESTQKQIENSQHESSTGASEQMVADLQVRIKELEVKVDRVNKQLACFKLSLMNQAKMMDIQASVGQESSVTQSLQTEIEKYKKESTLLHSTVDQLQLELDEKWQEVATVQDKLNKLESESNEIKEKNANLSQPLDEMKTTPLSISNLETERSKLQS